MKLINTTVFRLAMRFAFSFVLIFVIATSAVYYRTFSEIETQIDAELFSELNKFNSYFLTGDMNQLVIKVNEKTEFGEHLGHLYALLNTNKKYLAGNRQLALFLDDTVKNDEQIHYFQEDSGDEGESALRIAYKKISQEGYIIVAQQNNSLYELREHTIIAILLASIITIILSLAIGAHMGRIVLSRINKINQGMDYSIAANFKKTIPVPKHNDEFQALTLKLNKMLLRIEKLLSGMRQVTDNIAHDLRGPLNRMRSRLDVTLLRSRHEDEYRSIMAQTIDDCDELLKTFNSLLSIAQIEAGVRGNNWKKLNLIELISYLAELYEAVAEDKGQSFKCLLSTSTKIEVTGNKDLIIQAISNLIENAIKYTPKNGEINIEVLSVSHHPIVRIVDSGPGINVNDREKVLERFQRLDSARTSPGNGLGLSLASVVAKLHDAKLVLGDNHPGLKIEMIFPSTT